MIKGEGKILVLLGLIILVSFAMPVFAAEPSSYVPLSPLPHTTDPNCAANDPDCTANLGTYLPGVFKLLIAIAGGLAALMLIIGGVQYLSTDAISGKEDGKEKMTNALVGLILAISSWLILNTINPGTLKFTLSLDRVPVATSTSTGGGGPGVASFCTKSTNPPCSQFYRPGDNWPSDLSVRNQLNSAITVTGTGSALPCTTVGQKGCTSLYLLPSRAISGLNGLAAACSNCLITVTGGTEWWEHQSHGPGFARVDLNYGNTSDTIYRFLQNKTLSGATSAGTDNSCVSGYSAWNFKGAIYVLEGSHWHACY